MASTPWHRSSSRGVTAGEGEGTALLLLWKRPRPPSGHQPPADMSPKLRTNLINDALPPSRSNSGVSRLFLSRGAFFQFCLSGAEFRISFVIFLSSLFFAHTGHNPNSCTANCGKCAKLTGTGGSGLYALLDLLVR